MGFFQSTSIIKGNVFGVTPNNASSFNRQRLLSFARANNAISYVTPSFGGLTLHLMYSNSYEDDKAKFSKNAHYYGVGAKLTRGPIEGSAIFEVLQQKKVNSAYSWAIKGIAPQTDSPIYHATIGGSYDLNIVKPFAIYQYSHQEDYLDQHAFALGVSSPVAGGTLIAQARFIYGDYLGKTKTALKAKDCGTDPVEWTLAVGYDYPFSKRTYLWSYAGYPDANKVWKEQPTGAANTNDILYNGWQIGLGLVHRF